MMRSISRTGFLLLVVAGFALAAPRAATAQAIAITSPIPQQKLAAGPDFATDVVGDPWDMANREDFAIDPGETRNIANLRLENQRLIGAVQPGIAQISLFHRSYFAALNPGRNGRNFPISTSRFKKIAMKVYSEAAGQRPSLVWFFNTIAETVPGVPGYPEYYGHKPFPTTTAGGGASEIFVMDLPGTPGIGLPWTYREIVRGLRIHLNITDAAVGSEMGLDWVRLVPADAESPAVTLRWTGPPSGTYVLSVQELCASQGLCAASALPLTISTVGANSSGTNTFTWRYGVLPPGPYRLSIARSGSATATVDFTINDPPTINLTEPNQTGGTDDFATTVLGNPWDMSDAADVIRVPAADSLLNPSFSNGEFHASNPQGVLAPQVWTRYKSATPIDPVRYHRLTFKYRLDGPFDLSDQWGSVGRIHWGQIPGDNGLAKRTVTEAFVVPPGDNVYTFDLATLGFGVNNGIENPPATTDPRLWTAGLIYNFLIVAHEGWESRTFHFDYIRIAADAETVNGLFTVRWNFTDTDNASPTVSLFYDTDTDPTSGLVPIPGASDLQAGSSGVGSYVWSTGYVPPGTYHVYAQITDGVNQQGRYSTGPVRIVAPAIVTLAATVTGSGTLTSTPAGISCPNDCTEAVPTGTTLTITAVPTPGYVFGGWSGDPDCLDARVTMEKALTCNATFLQLVVGSGANPTKMVDLNGDGNGDLFRYRPATGAWSSDYSNGAGTFNSKQGAWSTDSTVRAADFNGDGLADMFLYNAATGQWQKCLGTSTGDFACAAGSWSPGWQLNVADFDGNGLSDVLVYNSGNGSWYLCATLPGDVNGFTCVGGAWSPGWSIMPADFNADAKKDLFFYNEATGVWYRGISGFTNGTGGFAWHSGIWVDRAGWQVVPGDYDGNGIDDIFIYRPTTGQWFICVTTGTTFTYLAGGWSPGWTLVPGDFDGDGRTEILVYNPSTGKWYVCFAHGTSLRTTFDSYLEGTWSPGWQVHVNDLNGDRRSDILVYNPQTGAYYQCLYTGAAPVYFSYTGGTFGTGWVIAAR